MSNLQLKQAQLLLLSGITTKNMEEVERSLDQGARWDLNADLEPGNYTPEMKGAIWRHNAAQMAFKRMLVHGDTCIVERLVQAGADFTPIARQMVDPANIAKKMAPRGKPEGLAFVLDNWPGHLGKWEDWRETGTDKTLLHLFSQEQDLSNQIRLLLDRGFDVNARDRYGNTPLHLSMCSVSTTTLIQAGADIVAANNAGKTPQRIFLDRMALEVKKDPSLKRSEVNTCWLNFYCLAIYNSIIKDPKPDLVMRRLDRILTPNVRAHLEQRYVMEPVYYQMKYLRSEGNVKKLTKLATGIRSKAGFRKQLAENAVPGNESGVSKPKM